MRAHIFKLIGMGSLLVLTSCTGAALTPEGLGLNKSADRGASSAGLREVSSSGPSAPSNVPQTYQTSGRLTFENGIRSALNWYPTIDEAVANLGRSTFEVEATKTGYLPKVTGGINSGSIVSSSDERWRPTAQIRAAQMLYDFGKLESEIASRNAKAVVSRADLLIAIDGVISDAENALNEV